MKMEKRLFNKGEFKHVSNYLSSRASADIQNLGIWPITATTKEVSETMGMVSAIREHGFSEEEALCFVVGDGKKPRTGVCISFFEKNYTVTSIDPDMEWDNNTVRGLSCHKSKIEQLSFDCQNKPVVIVHPHSHAEIKASLKSIHNWHKLCLISMPCCVKDKIDGTGLKNIYSYKDHAIFSPHNLINVYVAY